LRGKDASAEMSLMIRILGKNAEVRHLLKRLVGLDPTWKAVEGDFDKSIAGSPLKHPPGIVIVEVSRLDASLIPSIAAIRNKFGGSKILAVSDQRDTRLVLRMIHAGANGYMLTDRASEELAAAVKTIVAGKMFLSPGIAGLGGRRRL
jgi:DNA-binding NarL/FixJ family response regulator